MDLQTQLQNLGLNEKEATVYIALLGLGQGTAQQIAVKSGLKRSTTYVILDELISKALVSTVEKDKKTYFVAENPNELKSLLEKNKEDIENQLKLAKKIIPELSMVFNLTKSKAKVKLYEGKDGVKVIANEIYKSKEKTVLEIFNLDLASKYFPFKPAEQDEHRAKFIKKQFKIKILVLTDKDPADISLPHIDNIPEEDKVFLSQKDFPFHGDISVFDNKVAILNYKNKIIGITIEDPAIAESFRSLFELAFRYGNLYKQNYSIKTK